jgi:hypothetical protein
MEGETCSLRRVGNAKKTIKNMVQCEVAEASCACKRVKEVAVVERMAGVLVEAGASHRRLQIGRVLVASPCHGRKGRANRPARQDAGIEGRVESGD